MNKPAFPKNVTTLSGNLGSKETSYEGMTMRQWYKGMALANLPSGCPIGHRGALTGRIADELLKEDETVFF